MPACPKCGSENETGSATCGNCGDSLSPETGTLSVPTPAEDGARSTGQDSKAFGDTLGSDLEEAVEACGKKAELAGKELSARYHRTFGFAAPLISTVFVFLFCIIAIEIFGFIAGGRALRADLNEFLAEHLFFILALVFLSSYGDYLNKWHKREYRPIYPFIFAAGFVGSLLPLCRFAIVVGTHWHVSFFVEAAEFVMPLLPVWFVIVLILGYFVVGVFALLRKSVRCA